MTAVIAIVAVGAVLLLAGKAKASPLPPKAPPVTDPPPPGPDSLGIPDVGAVVTAGAGAVGAVGSALTAPGVGAIGGGGGSATAAVGGVTAKVIAATSPGGAFAAGSAGAVAGGAGLLVAERAVSTFVAGEIAGGDLVGGKITSQIAGAVGGRVAVGGVVGAKAGFLLDKQLGGSAGSISSVVAQTTGAAIGGVVATIYTTMAPALIVWVLPLAIVGLAVYGIVSAITDAERLRKGQAGAREAWETQRREIQNAVHPKLLVKLGEAGAPGNIVEDIAKVMSGSHSLGYMLAANRLAFLQWMRRPWGIGQTALSHAVYGRDRGYFVGDISKRDDLNKPTSIELMVDEYTFLSSVEGSIRTTSGVEAVKVEGVDLWRVAMEAGEVAGYAAAYFAWMKRERGFGVAAADHLKVGINEGFVWGNQDGEALVIWGKRFNWKEMPT